ncbi:hypothetical protein POM88_001976 [Heracleum sosnowskyi]|uniref:Origin recognition complex subunit 2 n=1 Tax=Heracleum sosnowskyi TaxID=360622 RepID=A0AAD8JGX5_9APIA|nr:hypothetical protein POM88_001976 [Heracleum sosnowskyi]
MGYIIIHHAKVFNLQYNHKERGFVVPPPGGGEAAAGGGVADNPNLSLGIKFSGDVLAASGLRNLLAAVIEEGKALKLLATAARLDIEDFLQKKVFLELACPPQESKSLDTISDINIVDEQELREVVSNIEPKHEKEIVSLIKSYKSLYSKWAFELRAGLGLLLYGFGSKKALIEDFASTTLTEYSVVVINGYLQSINLKQV